LVTAVERRGTPVFGENSFVNETWKTKSKIPIKRTVENYFYGKKMRNFN